MAIKYKELKDKLEKTPLTEEELNMINSVEVFIDSEIERKFKGYDVTIDLRIANFNIKIGDKHEINYDIIDARKRLMRKELDRRYKLAGWDIGEDYGERDSEISYWVIKGK